MDNILFHTRPSSYVCIFRQKKPARIFIVYGTDWNYTVGKIKSDAELLYIRTFDNILDGMGHKLILEQLDLLDLKNLIHQSNRHEQNLRPAVEALLK